MNPIIEMVIVFLVAIFVHEIGHIAVYKYYLKKFPPVRINKFGTILVGDTKAISQLTMKQYAIIAIVGILIGLIPIAIYHHMDLYLIYFLCSIIDTSVIVQFFSMEKKFVDVKLGKIKMVVE